MIPPVVHVLSQAEIECHAPLLLVASRVQNCAWHKNSNNRKRNFAHRSENAMLEQQYSIKYYITYASPGNTDGATWGSILEHNAKHIDDIMRSIMLRSRSIMLQQGVQLLLYISTKSCPTPKHYASRAWHNALQGLVPGGHLQGLGLRLDHVQNAE